MSSNIKETADTTGTGESEAERNMSDYAYIKSGWGNRLNFGLSYGCKPTPEGFEEATEILGALRQDHPGSAAGRRYRESQEKK